MQRVAAAVVAALLLVPGLAMAGGPVPPCAGAPDPTFAPVGAPPNVAVWYAEDLKGWQAPACTGWRQSSLDAIAASAAKFQHTGTSAEILVRFAAVSKYPDILYMSERSGWRHLIKNARALNGPDPNATRTDFTVAELTKDQPVYLFMGGNAMTNIVYRLQVLEHSPDHLIVAIENQQPIRLLGIPMLREGAGQFLFTFDKDSEDVWRSYVLVRVASLMNAVARPPMLHYANRALALLKFFSGQPTGEEIPAAVN